MDKQTNQSQQKPPDMREIMADYDKAVKFMSSTPAEAWEGLGVKTAISVYNETLQLPAYQKFLTEHNFKTRPITSMEEFQKIPTMDKYSYIQKYDFNEVNPMQAGKNLYSFALSSGTIDEPTIWPRYYNYEENILPLVVDMYLHLYWQIDKKSTLFINALSLGAWTAGFTMHAALRPLTQKYSNFTYASIGTDLDIIIFTIKKLSQHYDQVAIIGYTTFIRTILERLEQDKVNIKKLNLKLFIGGEGNTVEWRQYINRLISGNPEDLVSIIDNYASSDAGMSGLSSVMTNLIRDLAYHDVKLKENLFGQTDYIPTLLQYNPASYFMEVIGEEIVFTTKNTTPLVRYNIHDRGGIVKFREMEKILQKHNYDYKKLLKKKGFGDEYVWQQPFVYINGRRDDTVSVCAAKVFPEQIAPVLFNGKNKDIHGFKLSVSFDDKQRQSFRILLETKQGIVLTGIKLIQKKRYYHNLILKQLFRVNIDFVDAYRMDQKVSNPKIEIYSFGTGPFAGDVARTKPQLVIK